MTETTTAPAAVLIIDDHPLFCEALGMTLRSALGAEAVASANSLAEGLARMDDGFAPDLALLDLNLPDVDGVDGLIRLRARLGDTPVIVVSSLSDDRVIAAVLEAGAAGFVPKDSPRDVLLGAVRAVLDGDSWTPEGYIGDRSPADDTVARMRDLTPQQMRILQLVCEGKLNKQIAYDLGIAETTVKAHISAILRKLGVQSRTQAVLIAQKTQFNSILHDQ